MKSMLILKKLQISNANAISGLTWGFPGITHFLGFTHALSRYTQQVFGGELKGCGVICHDYQHKTQSNAYGRHSFALTRNPLTRKGETAPFNEEGKMHLTVSLVIEADFHLQQVDFGPDVDEKEEHLRNLIADKVATMRLAGGQIDAIEDVNFVASNSKIDSKSLRKELRKLLPGFALVDRSSLLHEHLQKLQIVTPEATVLDAWMDFSAIKFAPVKDENSKVVDDSATNETNDAEQTVKWEYQPKPGSGYLVPLMVGYKGISPLYDNADVKSTRDDKTPMRFAESVYGVGQWLSPHRITQTEHLLWRYQPNDDWYLCTNQYQTESTPDIQGNNN